jgi:hypothetical protein
VVSKRQIFRIALAKTHVVDLALLRQTACFREHLRGQVKTDNVLHVRRKGKRIMPDSRGDIQNQMVYLWFGELYQACQTIAAGMHRACRVEVRMRTKLSLHLRFVVH